MSRLLPGLNLTRKFSRRYVWKQRRYYKLKCSVRAIRRGLYIQQCDQSNWSISLADLEDTIAVLPVGRRSTKHTWPPWFHAKNLMGAAVGTRAYANCNGAVGFSLASCTTPWPLVCMNACMNLFPCSQIMLSRGNTADAQARQWTRYCR